MTITDKQLAAFRAVLKVGTATMAANLLNTSQPAVTRALKQLEAATRLTLFDRSGGRLTPTPAAKALIHEVDAAFSGVERVERAAENIRRANLGYLRVASLPAFSQRFFARAIARFRRDHPEISVAARTMLAPALVAAVRNFETDLGVAAYDVDEPGLITETFTDIDEVALLPVGHPLAMQREIAIEDFRGQVIVLLDVDDPYRLRLELKLRERDIDVAHSVETQTSLAVCALVAEGVGVGVVNPLTALDYIYSGDLVARRLATSFPFKTTLIRSAAGERSASSEQFEAALIRQRDEDLARVDKILDA